MCLLTLTMKDAQGYTTTKKVEVVDLALEADTLAMCATICTDLAAVSECQIIKATGAFEIAGLPFGAVGAGAYTDKGCTITGWVYGKPGKKASVKIPSPEAAFVDTDGTIKVAEALMAAYLAHFEHVADALVSDGEEIDTWIGGKVDK